MGSSREVVIVYLNRDQKRMLSGEEGQGCQKAMEILKAKGEAEGARRMVKLTYAHLMPPDTMFFPFGRQGRWARDLIGELTDGVTQLKVPTTMEPKFLDLALAEDLEFTDNAVKEMENIMLPAAAFYESLGVIPSYTAMPFIIFPTKVGQHVSIAESIAILWYNSIFGSRCERDDGVSSLAAAITGVYPEIGVHLAENRFGEVIIRPGEDLDPGNFTYADWDLYSLASSRKCKEKTPVFVGLPAHMSITQLKHLLAVIAVESGLAIMHIVGLTPEAPTLEVALGSKKPVAEFEVGQREIGEAYEIANTATDRHVDYVLLGCPHVTPAEMKLVAEALDGKRVNPNVKLVVSTTALFRQMAEDMGYAGIIESAGGRITQDMCIAFAGTQVSGTIATDSIKAAFFYSGFSSKTTRRVRFGTIQDCVRAAITGKWGVSR
jgi:predicted aconitase